MAERLAAAILADITLFYDARVRASRDLTTDLAAEIEEGRALFQSRVDSSLHDVFEGELMVWRGTARDRAQKLAGASVDRTRLLLALGAGVALVAVIAWLATHA